MRTVVFCCLFLALFASVCHAAEITQDRSKSPQERLLQELRTHSEYGDADAQFHLGLMYAQGDRVQQDYVEATKWFRKAATQGDADAQFNLGILYQCGDGVPQDLVEAAHWYRRAAEQADAKAEYNLGLMCDRGDGVQQDYAKALVWFRKATRTHSSI